MRYLIAILMVLTMATMATAQEDPEPTEPAVVYEYQIRWGSTGAWEPLTIMSMTIAQEAMPTEHNYRGILGTQTFKALVNAADTSSTPSVATIVFEIPVIAGNWWGFYHFRWGVRSANAPIEDTLWAEAYWVEIEHLTQPGRPIH